MSKRKTAADLRRSFNLPRRRPSVTNISARAMNIVHRKPGVTNVRSTSSYKDARNYVETQRNSTNARDARKSGDTRNETTKMPKTRFNLASGSNAYTSRLKAFPVETVRKTRAIWPYSPPLILKSADRDMCKRISSPPMVGNAHTRVVNLSSHGHGDALKSGLADELSQQPPQEEQNFQSPKKAAAVSQQHLPSEYGIGKINQSEATLNARVLSAEQPIHRPFVPKATRGMIARSSSAHKAYISPRLLRQPSCILRENLSLTAVEQTQQPQISTCHQASQISERPGANQPNQTASTPVRKAIPWKTDDTLAASNYEIQPIGGKSAVTQGRVSGLGEKPNTERQAVVTGQLTNLSQELCDHANQQQQHQYLNQLRRFTDVQTAQNAQQMHQQLRNNMIHQQEMQQRAVHKQQEMMAMTQQQMWQQLLPQHLKTTVPPVQINEKPCSNSYDQQQYYSEKLLNTARDIHTSKTNIPHYRVLMQQQNHGFGSFQTGRQHDWVRNQQVISDCPSLRGQITPFEVNVVSSNNTKCDGQLKATESPPTTNQPITQRPTGIQWPQGTQCLHHEAAICQYPPIQLTKRKPNLISCQRNLSIQRDQQVSTVNLEAPVTNSFRQSRQPQQQLQQQQQQQQQQRRMTNKSDPSRSHRLSHTTKNQYPQFTVEMIRDQELLIANLRQQKIPEDVMRRQFDALLNEQRRHLAFLNEQELAENVNETPPHIRYRASRVDQRPDWMGNTTPARMTVQPRQDPTDSWNQQNIERDGPGPIVPEQLKQYDQMEQPVFEHVLNDSQHSQISPYQLQNFNRQGIYHSWQPLLTNQQNATALSTPSPYNDASLPRMLSPPYQNTFNWSQQHNRPQFNPRCHAFQFNDFQPQCRQRLAEQQPYFQRQGQQLPPMRYKLQGDQQQQRHQTQQEESINGQQTQQPKDPAPKESHPREQVVLEAVKGNWGHNLNSCHGQHGIGFKPDGPSSLLKLRDFQRYIRPQMQNNGLQDAETVIAALKALKGPEMEKGLEYVAELGKKVTTLRLDGTQDPSELERIPPPPTEYLQRMQLRQQPRISFNGLCNTRNVNNPAPPPKSLPKAVDVSPSFGYPRQYYLDEKPQASMVEANTRRMVAEKENGSVASTMQKLHFPGTIFPRCEKAMMQCLPNQTIVRALYPQQHQQQQQLGRTDGRSQQLMISGSAKSSNELQRIIPIMPYKFDASEPLCQQQMDQFHRNRLTLKGSGESNITPLEQGSDRSKETALAPRVVDDSLGNPVYPTTCDNHQKTRPDYNYNHRQESSAPDGVVSQTIKSHCHIRVADGGEAFASGPRLHQAASTMNCHGQPEIREPKTFGGLTYLARKVDCLKNPPIVAPNTFIASKFLQPSANFS